MTRQLAFELAPGAVLRGKVVGFKPFGAFVDIGGVEGMLHVSELGYTRVERPEDVLSLGQPIEVRVDDIDPTGKVSLSLASAPEPKAGGEPGGRRGGDGRGDGGGPSTSETVSFEDAFDAELSGELGALGPASAASPGGGGGDAGGAQPVRADAGRAGVTRGAGRKDPALLRGDVRSADRNPDCVGRNRRALRDAVRLRSPR